MPHLHVRREARVRFRFALALIFAGSLVLAGCATPAPAVRAESAPGTSVATRATFAWAESGISWPHGAPAGVDADVRTSVRDAVVAALRDRGYVPPGAGVDPDFLVSFHVTVRDLPQAELCQLRNDVLQGVAHREVEVCRATDPSRVQSRFRQGTLIVFVVDRREGLLLWQGVAEGTASSTREAKARIRAAVARMFREFPARAG